jgi:glyoxylase-like metal-dependent hydrolase (beta-lactamase superfamily II)
MEDRYRSVIAGDLVSTVSTVVIDPPEGHLATYLASLRRVLAESPGLVYPSHGLPRRDGADLLREYLAHRADREAALVAALKDGVSAVPALVPRVYPEIDARLHTLAERSLRAGLEKLAEEGRVEAAGGGSYRLR